MPVRKYKRRYAFKKKTTAARRRRVGFKSKYGRKRKRVSVPKRRMRKKALVRSRFHLAPKAKEVPVTMVNDEPLIIRKPLVMLKQHMFANGFPGPTRQVGGTTIENSNYLPFLSGATEPNFRFKADLAAIAKQIKPYLQLYKEFKLTGVTIKFTPTWTKSTVTKALKQRVMTRHVANVDQVLVVNGQQQHNKVDNSGQTIISDIPGRIPAGWFPRLYYRIPKFGQASDYRTMMPNQTMAREMGASSKSLLGPLTFKYVPRMYKNIFDSSGMPVTQTAGAVGWLPTDSAFQRKFGAMDFVISPYPNFDSLSNISDRDRSATALTPEDEIEDPEINDFHKRLFGAGEFGNREQQRAGDKVYCDDRNSVNDQYVTVTRVYHLLFRGRITKYYNDEAWASGDYDLKPTPMSKIGWFHNKDQTYLKTGKAPSGDTVSIDGNLHPKNVTPKEQHDKHREFRDIVMAADTGMSRQDARSMMKDASFMSSSQWNRAVKPISSVRTDALVKASADANTSLLNYNGIQGSQGAKNQTQAPADGNLHVNPAMGDQDTTRTTQADTDGMIVDEPAAEEDRRPLMPGVPPDTPQKNTFAALGTRGAQHDPEAL